jgi:tripartite-type tricarboxylate transporter receptor subunit TctC
MKRVIKLHTRRSLLVIAGLLAISSQHAIAQDFPTKPITIKVGYPAGGPADTAARQLQPALQASASDGHTLLVLTGNDLILSPIVLAAARYKPEEFKLVHPLIFSEFVLVTGHDNAPADFDAFIREARAGRKELSFGNWGVGSTPHLIASDFSKQAGVKVLDVPYKGAGPIASDLIGKQIDYAFLPLAGATQSMIEGGKLKAVGLASKARTQNLPNLKSAGESQYLTNFDYMVWPGVFVPAGTSPQITAKLNSAIGAIVNGSAYQKWSRKAGNRAMTPMNVQQAVEFFGTERDRSNGLAAAMKIIPQ